MYVMHHVIVQCIAIDSILYAKQKQPRGCQKRAQPSKVEAIGMMQIN